MPVQIVVFLIKPIFFDDLVPLTLLFLAKREEVMSFDVLT